jgi:hypothetical protein
MRMPRSAVLEMLEELVDIVGDEDEPNAVRAGVRSCARCGRTNELHGADRAGWYIAARLSSKARIVSDVVPRLLELGIAVSSSWLTREDADEPPEVIAARDLGDIALRSSALVLDMTDGLGRNAMAMGEVGVAHSLGLPVYLVGETGNVLVKAVARRRWRDWSEAFEDVAGRNGGATA